MKKTSLTRRRALAGVGSLVAASPLMADEPPKLAGEAPGRIAPRTELVNVLEFESMAARMLPPHVYAGISGSNRSCFDRITLRPRMMVPTTHLDLTIRLFGGEMFAPIMVGPLGQLQKYHPDGEAGLARAASAAKTWMIVSSDSSMPMEKVAAESKTTLWYQTFADGDVSAIRSKIDQAVKTGFKAVCITAGAPLRTIQPKAGPAKLAATPAPALNWDRIEQLRQGVNVPVLIKGIMSPEEAGTAVKRGIQGIVVSNYGGLLTPGMAPPMEMLPSIADAVGGKAPILIDGDFRRGSDIFKALALGATAVLIARPVAWGLAAYGPDGAQQVLEMLQTELARDMAQTGKPTLKDIDRSVVKLHQV